MKKKIYSPLTELVTKECNIINSTRTYHVERRMYCFHESLPASRPPPVAFSPPKAPPISAPFVGIFAFTIPQSLPRGLHHIHIHEQVKSIIFRVLVASTKSLLELQQSSL
ncbi:hypothetical protein V8G54_007058 [Vigna mungo]|uniref:Uncharacterized protein n=1 Tax=Vigna mungo TaxID=3915 RepID=A0AAQ3P082_VIGMU